MKHFLLLIILASFFTISCTEEEPLPEVEDPPDPEVALLNLTSDVWIPTEVLDAKVDVTEDWEEFQLDFVNVAFYSTENSADNTIWPDAGIWRWGFTEEGEIDLDIIIRDELDTLIVNNAVPQPGTKALFIEYKDVKFRLIKRGDIVIP